MRCLELVARGRFTQRHAWTEGEGEQILSAVGWVNQGLRDHRDSQARSYRRADEGPHQTDEMTRRLRMCNCQMQMQGMKSWE